MIIVKRRKTQAVLLFRPLTHWRHIALYYRYYAVLTLLFEMFAFVKTIQKNEQALLLLHHFSSIAIDESVVLPFDCAIQNLQAKTQMTSFNDVVFYAFLFYILTTYWNAAGLGQHSNQRHFDVLLINPRSSLPNLNLNFI